MEHSSIIDQPAANQSTGKKSPPGLEPAAAELETELGHSGRSLNPRSLNPSVSAGIAAANGLAAAGLAGEAGRLAGPRFPAENGGHSLAEMAERDLDAVLQLLAERAQYITGASGAAIALRRDQRNDMLCRASAGAKAPKLGALLSMESGLSGESVRTRLPLRCDDAEHDSRVNRESCRELGIASVMIVPVLGDDLPDQDLLGQDLLGQDLLGRDQALGVFELFSSHAGAFDERDLSALQRLGEMVETALRLTRAAQTAAVAGEDSTEVKTEITTQGTGEHKGNTAADALMLDDEPVLEVELAEVEQEDAEPDPEAAVAVLEATAIANPKVDLTPPVLIPQVPAAAASAAATEPPAKRPLMWSATVHAAPDALKQAEADQSHVPPMLRPLKKCKVCGFPVSDGRALCVECDEKQWRGQLRMPLPTAPAKSRAAEPAVAAGPASISAASISAAPISATGAAVAAGPMKIASGPVTEPPHAPRVQEAARGPEAPILSGGLGTQESWLGSNKYILGAILLVAAVVAAMAWLR